MACRLIGAKPLSEPMLEYCWLDPWNKLQWNFNRNSESFIQENVFESVVCEMAAILSRPQCVKIWALEYSMQSRSGPPFTNDFSIAIQIWWKFHFAITLIFTRRSVQNFAHVMTAVLSWHVQNLVAIWWPVSEIQQGKVSFEFELRATNR